MGELEEQLKETEEERQKRETLMKAELEEARSQIKKLEEELRQSIDDGIQSRVRLTECEEILEKVRKEKEALCVEAAYLRKGTKSMGTEAVALPPRRSRRGPSRNQETTAPAPPVEDVKPHPLGCGTCSSTSRCACIEQVTHITTTSCGRCALDISRCQCLDETLNTLTASLHSQLLPEMDMKRSFASSSPIAASKRARISIEEMAPQEIDFTAMFSSKPPPPSYTQSRTVDYSTEIVSSRPPPGETCGFCDDTTYCACAEAAAAQAREREVENTLPPLMSEVTPPPSDSDISYAESYKLPSLYSNHSLHRSTNKPQPQSQNQLPMSRPQSSAGQQAGDSCANGPGTCQQCQDDPKSGLFCRSLAAIRATNPDFSGCCGNGGPGGCCKDDSSKTQSPPLQRTASQPSVAQQTTTNQFALSCADTYKTLASHKNFDVAANEIGNWLPKLATVAPSKYPGRGAMDIDAASVMSVIKYFDVRFGRE